MAIKQFIFLCIIVECEQRYNIFGATLKNVYCFREAPNSKNYFYAQ